jgi:hypothetical protein
MMADLDDLGREAFGWLVKGAVLGARSGGIAVTEGEVSAALLAGTPEVDGLDHLQALIRRKADEQGVPWPPTR